MENAAAEIRWQPSSTFTTRGAARQFSLSVCSLCATGIVRISLVAHRSEFCRRDHRYSLLHRETDKSQPDQVIKWTGMAARVIGPDVRGRESLLTGVFAFNLRAVACPARRKRSSASGASFPESAVGPPHTGVSCLPLPLTTSFHASAMSTRVAERARWTGASALAVQ
ncbi:hypothetical protein HPB51_006595 [Rhipicephalus microplus]|uniref:Uncharacterized protein n=1 Tax=Rhipicephalus microplus TaxID=6941 RepID=A0A9J6E6D8_RHIMP|nr:hypothetical protein HPB51_006595 [Rhipicephalus microplus]